MTDEIAKHRLSSGNVTAIDVYAYKQDVLHELLGTVLSALPSISAADLHKIRESCGSHRAFRNAFGQDGSLNSSRAKLPNFWMWWNSAFSTSFMTLNSVNV